MKSPLLFILLFFQTLCFSQMAFEEIASPEDFNVFAMKKSPTGEYFTQADNDPNSIYTSTNGQDWTKAPLPENHELYDIQFFSDGTPVLKAARDEHMIRRDGIWHLIDFNGGWGSVEASFIKGDTLFAFENNVFAYSLDKGQNFTTVCQTSTSIVDHTANLWRINNHFILHHTAGASDDLSIFDEQGNQVFNQGLSTYSPTFLFNECGDLVIVNNTLYYRLEYDGFNLSQGNTVDIIPNFTSGDKLIYQGDNYYLKSGQNIYKSPGCNMNWESIANNEAIESEIQFYVSPQEDILLYNSRSNYYIEQNNGTNLWEEHPINIDYASIYQIDEAALNHQISITPNALFNKNTTDPNWTKLDLGGPIFDYQFQYAPNGDLYVNKIDEILYSQDNGLSFSSIEIPSFSIGLPKLDVLDNEFILIYNSLGNLFYTSNNGQDWTEVNEVFSIIANPIIKLVDNAILIAELDITVSVTKIDLVTNEVTSDDFVNFSPSFILSATFQDDGTLYLHASDIVGTNEGLYRYQFGEEVEFVDNFQELIGSTLFSSSANEIFTLGTNNYFKYNGIEFTEHTYSGLPTGPKRFYLSKNEHVYAVIGDHYIYRSTEPLATPQFVVGSIFHDANSDCVEDPLDEKLQFWKVKVENENHLQIKTTDTQGNFKFSVPDGDFTVSALPVNDNWALCEPSFEVTVDEMNTLVSQNFRAKPLVDCAGLDIDFSTPRLRRCFDNYYAIRIRNTGPQVSDATQLTLELDPFFDLTSVSIPYTQVGDNTITVDLGPIAVNDQIAFKIFFTLNCDAELGMEHCLSGSLFDLNICQDNRSSYIECQENIGSFDPNDKRTFNEEGLATQTIDKDEYIYYHIRFQNTGSDTAFTVRVVDPLSPVLDVNTLEMLSASHPYAFSITDGPELIVNFENILLPDSTTNEPASNGFFKFKIKPLPEFDYGTSIPNQAGIYFDFNDPVITNEAILVIEESVGIEEIKPSIDFAIFPNPTKERLTISMTESDLKRVDTYEIINQLGQVFSSQTIVLDQTNLNIAKLSPGLYHLVLKENGSVIGSKKFVKL